MEVAELGLSVVNTIAIVVGVISTIVGVNAWKKQLKGSTNYELARRYLRAVYKVRDAINHVRNPFILASELSVALKDSGLSEQEQEDRLKSHRAVYALRWREISSALSDLHVELLEGEVSWGKDAASVADDLLRLVRELLVNLEQHLDGSDRPFGNEIVYRSGKNDQFGTRVDGSIEKIEKFLRPHLK